MTPTLRALVTPTLRALGLSFLLAPLGLAPGFAQEVETYGLVFVVDGAKGDLFKKYAREGVLENVRKYFLDGGVWVNHTTAPFPTITGAGMPAVLTGAFAGRHRIPSLYFFSREDMRYPVLYTPLEALDWDRWLAPDVKTIWEYFPGKDDAISFGPALHRGSDDHVSIFWNLKYKPMEVRAKIKLFWRSLKRRILSRPPARLTVVYNGWFDHMEHLTGADHPDMLEHYLAVDHQIGEAVETFQRTVQRRASDTRTVKTFVALVSDHGHQDIREVVSIDKYIRNERGARVLDKIWSQLFGFKLKGTVPDSFDDREILVAAGEGHALLYFPTPSVAADGTTITRLDWKARPSFDLLRAYPFHGQTTDVIAEAASSRAVSFVVAKNHETGAVHVVSATGEAVVERRGPHPRDAAYAYEVIRGEDPLGFREYGRTAGMVGAGFFPGRDWQLATVETDYPDAVVQFGQAFDAVDRSPDLYLSAAPYISIGDLVDGEKSRSKHGGLTKDEAWATLAFHGDGLTPGEVYTARNVDMVPTMLHLLGVDYDPDALDGEVIPEIRERSGF